MVRSEEKSREVNRSYEFDAVFGEDILGVEVSVLAAETFEEHKRAGETRK